MVSIKRAVMVMALCSPGLAQCDRERPREAPETPETPIPAPSVQPTAMDRAGMIAALSRAASAYAGGEVPAEALTGRRFSVRLPFGCAAPGQAPAQSGPGYASWAWAPDRQAIELRLTPADWLEQPPTPGGDLDTAWAAADGVWITRPWLSSDTCPPPLPAISPAPLQAPLQATDAGTPIPAAKSGDVQTPPPAAPSPPSAGLALYSSIEGSRVGRRDGQPYTHLIRGDGDAAPSPSARGWRVLLEGRIGAFPDGRAIRCRAGSPDQRPVCIIAVQVDKVAFEDGVSGRQLAEWRPGGS